MHVPFIGCSDCILTTSSLFCQLILSRDYLELRKIEAIEKNNKVYYGNNIPSMFLDTKSDAKHVVAANQKVSVGLLNYYYSL